MQIEVVYTVWGAEDVVFQGGIHELSADECACGETHGAPSAELLRLIAGAEATGSVNVLDYSDGERTTLDSHVQSQEDGEAALVEAMGDWVPPVKDDAGAMLEAGYWTGEWHEGNLTQFILRLEDMLAADELAKNEPLEERVKRARRGEDDVERQGLSEERIASINQHLEDARARLALVGERS